MDAVIQRKLTFPHSREGFSYFEKNNRKARFQAKCCKVLISMEPSGVYWYALFERLKTCRYDVCLFNSIDIDRGLIYVRFGKGGKDRGVPLPQNLTGKLNTQLETVGRIHAADLADGFGEAWLPNGFARKIGPAARDLGWQYLFPAKKRSTDPRSGRVRRHHVLASGLQKAVRTAVRRAGLTKRVTCHTVRHSYATHLLENGVNIRIVQELMGHADVKTTEIYTHIMQKNLSAVASPLDVLHSERPSTR